MPIQKNDRHDISSEELALIREGHKLWLQRQKALKTGNVEQQTLIDEALQTVWQSKSRVRRVAKARREAAAKRLSEYFSKRKAA